MLKKTYLFCCINLGILKINAGWSSMICINQHNRVNILKNSKFSPSSLCNGLVSGDSTTEGCRFFTHSLMMPGSIISLFIQLYLTWGPSTWALASGTPFLFILILNCIVPNSYTPWSSICHFLKYWLGKVVLVFVELSSVPLWPSQLDSGFSQLYPPPPHIHFCGTSLEPKPWRGQRD